MREHPRIELIDLGVGEPDEMAPEPIVKTLIEEAQKPENRGYTDNGIEEFRQAAARYLEQVFGVSGLNPDTQINHSIGSKSALALLPSALVDPGDVVLMTVPGYPVFGTHSAWYGAEVVNLPLSHCDLKTTFCRTSIQSIRKPPGGPRSWFLTTRTTRPERPPPGTFTGAWSSLLMITGWR